MKLVSENPNKLLQIPEVRSIVSAERLERAQQSIKIFDSGCDSRSSTIEHNLNNLLGLSGFDRGSTLVQSLLLLEEFQLFSGFAKCLCVGPRNEAELLALLGFGLEQQNIRGLDLISYSDFVDLGDMHEMPYADNSYEIIIAGWVLAYSVTVDQAIHEICRVLRPGGIVSIGWDMSRKYLKQTNEKILFNEHGILDQSEGLSIERSADIIQLFLRLGYQLESLFTQDSKAPYDVVTRRNILVAKVYPKAAYPAVVDTIFRDDIALRALSRQIGNSGNPTLKGMSEVVASISRD